jgi:redox-sensitive bicupin YhaK (pirin superfamily)
MGNGEAGGANAGVILPGDVQRMSAGTGVRHSEFNHAQDSATHFLQIWILPEKTGIEPGYEQKHFSAESKRGRLVTVAARDGRDGAVTIHADAAIHAGLFTGEERAELALNPRRITYVHVVRGALRVNDRALKAGDAARLEQENQLVLEGGEDAEVLVFDLAP